LGVFTSDGRPAGRNDFNVNFAGMISTAKGAIRVAKFVTWRIATRLYVFWSGSHRYWKHVTHAVGSCVVKISYSTHKNRFSCEGLHKKPCFRYHIPCQYTLFTLWTFLTIFFTFWISWTQVGSIKVLKLRPSIHSPWCGHHVSLEVYCHFGHFSTGLKCLCSRVIKKSDGANSCVVTRYSSTVKRSNLIDVELKLFRFFRRFLGWLHYLICCINGSHLSTL